MLLTDRTVIKRSNSSFEELDNLCFLSKNLYNAGLYMIRQHFFATEKMLSYPQIQSLMVKENNVDFRALPAKVSQQTLRLLEKNFKSFFVSLKSFQKTPSKFKSRPKPPKYLDKNGRFSVVYTDQTFSKPLIKEGILKLSKTNLTFKTMGKTIRQLRVTHRGDYIVVETIYEENAAILKEDNRRYCSIDLGLNNLATIGSNVLKPIIINGKPLKAINHYYNKKLSKLKSDVEIKHKKKSSKKIKRLNSKRHNKIQDYLHKASREIVNHLVSNDINTLIVGKNKAWKQDINLGSRNNQNFVHVPHTRFVDMITYKCLLKGITVVLTEESYTSRCSFIDNEPIKKHESFKGKRMKRGLFKSEKGLLINADLNGALNILRKVIGNFNYDPIKVCSAPSVLTVK